jgi:hypothetical protein
MVTMPQAKRMTIEYDNDAEETWTPETGWVETRPKNQIQDYWAREADKYLPSINHLNAVAPVTWPGGEWGFETSGGGLCHASVYWVDANGNTRAWIAIDDNDGRIMIGAYWGEDIEDMVYEGYVETTIKDMVEYGFFSQIARHAQAAMKTIEERINCTHWDQKVVEDTWHEDEEVMDQVRECTKCKRRATFTGRLVYGQVGMEEWI